jgi:hypothetical protein
MRLPGAAGLVVGALVAGSVVGAELEAADTGALGGAGVGAEGTVGASVFPAADGDVDREPDVTPHPSKATPRRAAAAVLTQALVASSRDPMCAMASNP